MAALSDTLVKVGSVVGLTGGATAISVSHVNEFLQAGSLTVAIIYTCYRLAKDIRNGNRPDKNDGQQLP